jgi:hypothetical protein
MDEEKNGIAFRCVFVKATTLVDNGWRLSFDLSEQDAAAVTKIAALRNENLILVVTKSDV